MDPTLPFIDLHRHLDGNVRLQTILDLAAEHRVRLPADTVETLRPHVQVTGVEPDLVSWLRRIEWMTAVLGDLAACRRVARENVEDAAREGLDYVELRFSPGFMARPHGLDPGGVVEAVLAGVEEGRAKTGLPVAVIGILSRTFGPEACRVELEALLTRSAHLVALDLAGDERGWPAGLFRDHFARGRDAGLAVTVHAGEADGPESVWSAIRDLGATRLGHGVRAAEDPVLLDYLGEHGTGLEMNLSSNVQTATVGSYAAHPLKRFLDLGLRATINTDDPVISGIDLAHELRVAAPAAGLSPADVALAQRHARDLAYLDFQGEAKGSARSST